MGRPDALVGVGGGDVVDALHSRRESIGQLPTAVELDEPRVGGPGLWPRRGDRVAQLPGADRARVGVEGEQLVEDGGAGPRQAHHPERQLQLRSARLRVLPPPRRQPHLVRELLPEGVDRAAGPPGREVWQLVLQSLEVEAVHLSLGAGGQRGEHRGISRHRPHWSIRPSRLLPVATQSRPIFTRSME